MYYCGNDCQKKDWNQHKLECKIYKENFDQLQSTGQSDLFFRFVLRLHLYLKRNPFFLYEQHKFLNDKNSSVCIFDIINRMIPTINQDTVSGFLFMSQQYSLLKIKWDPKRMMSCFHLCYEYGIDIFNYEMQSLGSGLYLAESQLKHSCSPNVTSLFNGAQLVMRTTRPIKSGEQITVDFIIFLTTTVPFKSEQVPIIYPTFSYPCDKCVSKTKIPSKSKKELMHEMFVKAASNHMNNIFELPMFEKYLSFINGFYNECDLGIILPKIILLQNYALHNDVKELSVAELAKKLKITLPSVYNEIFENTYFNREEKASFTIVKALANVEFNVKKN